MDGSIKACPKCGSDKSGYHFKVTMTYGYAGVWGKEPEATGEVIVNRSPVYATCGGCNRRVKITEASGEDALKAKGGE